MTDNKFETWGVLQIMGHKKYAGYISEQAIAGAAMVRIDVPAVDGRPAFTELFGVGSIYAISPTSEEVAREIAKGLRITPVTEWDFSEELRAVIETGRRMRAPLALLSIPEQMAEAHDDDDSEPDEYSEDSSTVGDNEPW